MTKRNKKLIHNSTIAEFLIFTRQVGEQSVAACYKDETIWLPQKGFSGNWGSQGIWGQSTQKKHAKSVL